MAAVVGNLPPFSAGNAVLRYVMSSFQGNGGGTMGVGGTVPSTIDPRPSSISVPARASQKALDLFGLSL